MAGNQVWAIDIGETALKAVKARKAGGRVEALAFDVIPYEQVLSAPGVDADAQVRQALSAFVGRNAVKKQRVVATISARSALIRFVKLPPVDPKKIADVVQYEASQHIPFPLDEVVWDHQAMRGGQVVDFEVEVGMFAMRREIVRNFLTNLLVAGLQVDKLQLTPIALCNFVYYDRSPKEALVVLDVGASNSTLLVLEGESVWIRNLSSGGNDFTQAIASKFNISFSKAEVLKRRGSANKKYAQQIFDALRTPARKLADEVQRSLGFYKSSHKEAKIGRILLMGGSFALTQLARFVGVSLGLDAEVFREPKKVSIAGAVGLDNFRKYAASYGVALGLAVEELGFGIIETNMLPKEIVKKRVMSRKQPFAVAAAALILVSVLIAYGFPKSRLSSISESAERAPKVIDGLAKLARDIKATEDKAEEISAKIDVLYKAGGVRRDVWLDILDAITTTIPSEDPKSAILLVRLSSVELTIEEVKALEEAKAKGERGRLVRKMGLSTEEELKRIEEEQTTSEEDEQEYYERLELLPQNRLIRMGIVNDARWNRMINVERTNYVQILEECEKLGIITVNWGARKGRSMPTYQYVPGYKPGDSVSTGSGGVITITGVEIGTSTFIPPVRIAATPLAFAGIAKVINLKLRAERRALTKNLSAAVDEIDNQFVKPLKKYPFFESVEMGGNPEWGTYVEDMQGYRLGKLGTYQPAPGEKTRNVEWITFDVHITVDPTKSGLAAATASTAATS